jgi:hypothetical protein
MYGSSPSILSILKISIYDLIILGATVLNLSIISFQKLVEKNIKKPNDFGNNKYERLSNEFN